MIETLSTLLKSDQFNNTSSNGPPPLSIAPIPSLLPSNRSKESDKQLQTSVDIVRKYKRVKKEQGTKRNTSVYLKLILGLYRMLTNQAS
jgi:hypothetical protein